MRRRHNVLPGFDSIIAQAAGRNCHIDVNRNLLVRLAAAPGAMINAGRPAVDNTHWPIDGVKPATGTIHIGGTALGDFDGKVVHVTAAQDIGQSV
jgi:hypothetical protein